MEVLLDGEIQTKESWRPRVEISLKGRTCLQHGSLPDSIVPALGYPEGALNIMNTSMSCCGEGFLSGDGS